MKQDKILATKIKPTLIIGEKIKISTRNIKSNKKPPKKSEDCKNIFKEYITDDTTDAILLEDYTKILCKDILESCFLPENIDDNMYKHIILQNSNDSINAKRILIYSTNKKLIKLEKVINKSHTHKASEYNIKHLTICGIEQEEDRIFKSNIIDDLRKYRITQEPDNSYYQIN